MEPSLTATPSLPGSPGPRCPLCNRKLVRTRRSVTDRLISLVTPVHRYYCIDFCCDWQGRIRAEPLATAVPLDAVPKKRPSLTRVAP